MAQYALPVFHGLLIWWFSTCLILLLDGLPKHTFRWSMTAATLLLVMALYGLTTSAADTSVAGAYTAFTCAVVIWGWLEISFYMGFVTGPRTQHCVHGCHGWRHFFHAVQVSLYHELAVLVLAGVVIGLTWGSANLFGSWTFIILWWMHQSARLNVFLGVSNLNAEFLPEHLAHLQSFFRSASMNLLFPFSVTLSTVAAVMLGQQVVTQITNPFQAVGYTLLTTMMGLAILEHWFLVLPPSATKIWNSLWHWSLGSRVSRIRPLRNHKLPLPRQVTIGGRP
jgi:putative photosynthetic complex assembly protein 2